MDKSKEKEKLMDLIVDAKRADPETGSFTEWLAAFLLDHGVMVPADDGPGADRLRELIEADKAERCVVLPFGGFTDKDGENALKSAMNTCFYYNNPVTRYVADAVAEKLAREEAEAALEKMKEAARE